MTFPPPPGNGGLPPRPHPPGAASPGPYPAGPYPQAAQQVLIQPYGPVPPSYPGFPRPPRRNRGPLIASILGVIALLVLMGTAIGLTATGSTGSDDTAAPPLTSQPTTPPSPSTPGGTAAPSETDVAAIRAAMQRFVDAVNSRQVPQIQAAVCSAVRSQVNQPVDITGNVVLEGIGAVTVTGDIAQSQVITHQELGNRRSDTKSASENYSRENGTWYVCPGAEPDIGT